MWLGRFCSQLLGATKTLYTKSRRPSQILTRRTSFCYFQLLSQHRQTLCCIGIQQVSASIGSKIQTKQECIFYPYLSQHNFLDVFMISSYQALKAFYNHIHVQTYWFVSFDISTSEICRDIDPKSDGMMMGMVITADSRFTAAFTKYESQMLR